MAVFVKAGPAEILRSVQKDRVMYETLDQQLSDVLLQIFGTSTWLRYRHITQVVSQLLYYGFTTLSGYQTLGEEYTGIVQVDSSLRYVPSVLKRTTMVCFETAGLTVIDQLLGRFQQNLIKNTEIAEDIKVQLISYISALKAILPFIQNLHRAIFYWSGNYYDITKRILRINYIRTQPWLRGKKSMYGFKILGIITMIHLCIFVCHSTIKWWQCRPMIKEHEIMVEIGPMGKCPLCLDKRKGTSTTPCGHLFCWYCILDWLQTNNKCPICREHVVSSRIVPLVNY